MATDESAGRPPILDYRKPPGPGSDHTLIKSFGRPPQRILNGAAISLLLLTLFNGTSPNGWGIVNLVQGFGWLGLILVWLIKLICFLLTLALTRIAPDRRAILGWMVVPILVGMLIVSLLSAWPLRIAFWANRPALERAVQQATGGTLPPEGARAGIYWVQSISPDKDRICLETDRYIISNDGGFIYVLHGEPRTPYPAKVIHLGGPWYSWVEDEPLGF